MKDEILEMCKWIVNQVKTIGIETFDDLAIKWIHTNAKQFRERWEREHPWKP